MKPNKSVATIIFSSIGMLVLIFDSKTALQGAAAGLELCLRTVIISLFPFFVLSILLTGSLTGKKIVFLSPVARLCGVPDGAESLLLIGLLGGYPVGAQCITQAYLDGKLERKDAHRLLGFCSNAGPAFIFGIAGSLFSSVSAAWWLWAVHILSALAVGFFLPGKRDCKISSGADAAIDLPNAAAKATGVMAGVCGWVILFRVINAFLDRWILWLLPDTLQYLIIGVLELANGCHILFQAEQESLRFVLCSVFLAFGGVCVGMQTMSVTGSLRTGWYFPGKAVQSIISLFLSAALAPLLFRGINRYVYLTVAVIAALICAVLILLIRKRKKAVAFSRSLVYNG